MTRVGQIRPQPTYRKNMLILTGYPRIATQDQDNTAQIAALNAEVGERIFNEKASAGRWDRPELSRLLDPMMALSNEKL